MNELILINIVLLVGACMQSVVGYGIAILCAPLLFLINPQLVPIPMIMLALLLSFLMIIRERAALRLKEVSWAMAGNVTGILLAGFILFSYTINFSVVFGLLILIAVIISICGYRPVINRINSVIAGFASGIMGTLTSVGGPPIALLYQSESNEKIRANVPAFFLLSSVLALIALYAAGKFQNQHVHLFLYGTPGIFIGFFISPVLKYWLASRSLRPFILTIAGISGLYSIIQGITS